ncbi:MAG: 3-phosphoserine/phosphohydroxythreonine transaminase [SAR324 cluster bacterium]|nr:3-phosphoserine/phosphohydroxythreonine transaminase [SAR324 cluster bacterium]MBF0350644.1 3-phosphoserine/phosphohydroxythreonine transaminase [SAR324 cluster bacterium]
MTNRVYNFGAGPAMLPISVMEKAQAEFLDFNGMGASVIEISHRSKEFEALLAETDTLFKELTSLPENYRILYVHGGARMQFSAIPMNLIARSPSRKAIYVESGDFAKIARKEAERYGKIDVIASSADTKYDRIPAFDVSKIDQDAAYFHITGNNTIYGTRWQQFPETGNVPLVADFTSEMLSRVVDFSKFGIAYAGLQKNLGPSGVAVVVIREDLLGHAIPETPTLLDYAQYEKDHSMTNTINTFAIYMMKLVLEWFKELGGIAALEKINVQKANILYDLLDNSGFYKAVSHPDHRSIMTVTFNLPSEDLLAKFLKDALKQGLYALKGHRNAGGVRASIYNAMPVAGVNALADFMKEFERQNG